MAPHPIKPRRILRVLDGLWYAGSAPQTLMALTALLAGTLAFAAIFPQQPAGLQGAAAEQWLTGTASSYREAGPFLRAVGAFRVTAGPWMRVLLAALALNLTLRAAAQARFLRHLRRPAEPPAAPPRLVVRRASLPGPLEAAVARIESTLQAQAAHVTIQRDPDRAQIYAVRRPAAAAGPLLTYIGPLLILLGLFLNDTLGWRAADIALAPGNAVLLSRADNLRITLDGLTSETNAAADLTLTRATAGKSVRAAPGRPAVWGSTWLSHEGTGPALTVTAQDSSGRPLVLQSLAPGGEASQTLHLLFQQTQAEQAFALPTYNLTFRAVSYPALPEQGFTGPVFFVEGYRGADPTPAFEELVQEQASLTVDGLTIAFGRDHYVTLNAAGLPGLPILALGAILTLAGVMSSAWWGPVRAWIGAAQDEGAVAIAVRAAVAAEPERLAFHLMTAVQTASVPAEAPEPSDVG